MALAVDHPNRNNFPFGHQQSVPNNSCMDEVDNRNPSMRSEVNRLSSFRNWGYPFMNPRSLAAAGFYSLNRGDLVRCAFCGIDIGQWEQGDDAMTDHKKWSFRCPFVQGFECGNVPLGSSQSVPSPPLQTTLSGMDVCGIYDFHVMTNSLSEHYQRPVFPHYATVDERLKSYSTWPANKKPHPKDLAAAGFFYRGPEDQTICFHCRGGLKEWKDTDIPWEQHAKWFPSCRFLRVQKGSEFISEVAAKFPTQVSNQENESEDQRSETASSSSGCSSGESTSNSPLPPAEARSAVAPTSTSETLPTNSSVLSEAPAPPQLNEETQTKELCRNSSSEDLANRLNFVPLCKVCYTNSVEILFRPCQHCVTCTDCAFALANCPICRQHIRECERAFF